MQRILTFLRQAAAVAIALAASVAIAACGGSSSAGSSAASNTNTGLEFAACVRTHGVPDYPDPTSGKASAVDSSKLSESPRVVETAMTKCQKFSPDSNFGPVYSNAQMAKVRAGALAMAKCMRAHGVDLPDPIVSRGPGGHAFEYGYSRTALAAHPIDVTGPTFKAANGTCSHFLDSAIVGKKG
jgi:hypothetical protein